MKIIELSTFIQEKEALHTTVCKLKDEISENSNRICCLTQKNDELAASISTL
jgi:hypothetical protein